jgi:sugar phosphate isomerase/epimerase
MKKFSENFLRLQQEAGAEPELYLENNVVSETNLRNFGNADPFFLTSSEGYSELENKMKFSLLLDLAHLKVSCNSLRKDFKSEFTALANLTDYIHVSDNDGRSDTNGPFEKNSEMYKLLSACRNKGKTFTLEVYSGKKDLKRSYENLSELAGV